MKPSFLLLSETLGAVVTVRVPSVVQIDLSKKCKYECTMNFIL